MLVSRPRFYSSIFCPLKLRNSANFYSSKASNAGNSEENSAPLSDISFTEHDWIGPRYPDQSNVRKVRFRKPQNESPLEQKFRLLREDTEEWHVLQWNEHNEDFHRSKKVFMAERVLEKQQNSENQEETSSLSPEEMSEFYKEFLLRTRSRHLAYNWQWYRRNFHIAFLALTVRLHRLRKLCWS